MRTSESVTELGLYTSTCCQEELIFDIGDVLCRCPHCESVCDWELTDVLISHKDLDSFSPTYPGSGLLRPHSDRKSETSDR